MSSAGADSVSIDCSKLTASSSLSSNLETRELASSAMSFSPPPLLPREREIMRDYDDDNSLPDSGCLAIANSADVHV